MLWAVLCCAVGAVLGATQMKLYFDRVEATYQAAEADAARAEQALQRAFDLALGLHSLLRIKHDLLQQPYSNTGLALDQYLKSMVNNGRFGLVQVGLVNGSGLVVWATRDSAIGVSVADGAHVHVPLDDPDIGTYVSAPMVGRTSGRWSIQVAQAIRDADSDMPIAVSLVSIDPVELSRALLLSTGVEGRRIVVHGLRDGALLARSEDIERYLGRRPDPNHPLAVAGRKASSGREQYFSTTFNATLMAAYRVPQGIPVVVSAVSDRAVEMRGYWMGVVASLIGYAMFVWSSMRVAVEFDRKREAQNLLQEQAERDPLTGLLNRRAMELYSEKILARAQGSEACSVLLLDVDRFKDVNDIYGHAAGDRVLQDVAAVIQQVVRVGDAVCRWGGEEVLILLRNCNQSTAFFRAEDLRRSIEAMYANGQGHVPNVTASIGVAVFPRDGADLKRLIHAADQALYAAKRAGRNRVLLARELGWMGLVAA